MAKGQLYVLEGQSKHINQIFLLSEQEERLLGRSSTAHFRIEDVLVSSLHCMFTFSEQHFMVQDLLSANGVLVNGELVDTKILQEGDKIKVGKTLLEFSLQEKKDSTKKYLEKSDISWDFADDDEESDLVIAEKRLDHTSSPTPLGRSFQDSSDLNVCRLAIKNHLLSHSKIREALEEPPSEEGKRQKVSEILKRKEWLKQEDIDKLLLEHKYHKVSNKDMPLASAIIQNKILSQEQVEECLELQKKYFQEKKQISRLSEIFVQKGYLSVKENNKIVKSFLENKKLQ